MITLKYWNNFSTKCRLESIHTDKYSEYTIKASI